jgi:hypothetical protein
MVDRGIVGELEVTLGQQKPAQAWCTPTRLQGAIFRKALIFVLAAVRT